MSFASHCASSSSMPNLRLRVMRLETADRSASASNSSASRLPLFARGLTLASGNGVYDPLHFHEARAFHEHGYVRLERVLQISEQIFNAVVVTAAGAEGFGCPCCLLAQR